MLKVMEQRRNAIESDREQFAREEERLLWAEAEMQRYTDTQRRRILAYLSLWVKEQHGHGEECECGECD